METWFASTGENCYRRFKIDFIVWKQSSSSMSLYAFTQFKIDFIVWKLIRPGSTASSRLSVYNRLYSMETMNWKLC